MLSFTRRVRKEHVELTYMSLHAAYPVIPQCYCLEIHTARATITPDHHGGLNMAMDQTTAAMALSHVSLSLLYPTLYPAASVQCLSFARLALHPFLNQLYRVGLGISQTKTN